MLQHDFIRMQGQMQFRSEKIPQAGNQSPQIIPVGVHDVKIIHITPVVAAAQLPFDILIEFVQINIAEKLRSKITDRKPALIRCIKQTFRTGKSLPQTPVTQKETITSRIVENDLARQVTDQIVIEQLFPSFASGSRTSGIAVETHAEHIEEFASVDIHEITPNVQFEQIAGAAEIIRTRPNMGFQPSNAVKRTFVLTTRITVGDERTFEHRSDVIEQQMMHDAIAEIRSENLPLDRNLGDEAHTAPHPITPFGDFVIQRDEIFFEPHFEMKLAPGIAFIAAGIVIGTENIRQ